MAETLHRLDFYPPQPQGTGRALTFALLAHGALLLALTWGVHWQRQAATPSASDPFEAQLWDTLPQPTTAAAPALTAPPTPAPASPPTVQPETESPKAADIQIEKAPPKPKPEPKPQLKEKTQPKDEKPQPQQRSAQASKAPDSKPTAQQRDVERKKYLERISGLASQTTPGQSNSSAPQAGRPSQGYAGQIKARVRPNLIFAGSLASNAMVSIEVRLAPDGTILGRPRVLKSSGSKEWDDAVVRAFEKTEALPRDGGKIWSPLLVDWYFND